MARMNEIKQRIKSIKETRHITKAMKLISASKLKKARQQLELALPYFDRVKLTIAEILSVKDELITPFIDARQHKNERKTGYIVVSGDKGLAGGYNANIIRLLESRLAADPDALLFIAGQLGRNYFLRKNYTVYPEFDYPVQNPSVYRAREIAEVVFGLYREEKLDDVYLVFTLMKSSVKYEPYIMKILPLNTDELAECLNAEGYCPSGISYKSSTSAFPAISGQAASTPNTSFAEIAVPAASNANVINANIINSNVINAATSNTVNNATPAAAFAKASESSDAVTGNSSSAGIIGFIYEPSPSAVFSVLLKKYLKGIIYGALVEGFASEQSARMMAMDSATNNADEMLYKLSLSYNRARQSAITQEISEIVGGAAALK